MILYHKKECDALQQIDRLHQRDLPGGGAVEVTVNGVVAENALMPPKPEAMVATDTLYAALGTKLFSVTLVLDEYTVMGGLHVSLASWYLTL